MSTNKRFVSLSLFVSLFSTTTRTRTHAHTQWPQMTRRHRLSPLRPPPRLCLCPPRGELLATPLQRCLRDVGCPSPPRLQQGLGNLPPPGPASAPAPAPRPVRWPAPPFLPAARLSRLRALAVRLPCFRAPAPIFRLSRAPAPILQLSRALALRFRSCWAPTQRPPPFRAPALRPTPPLPLPLPEFRHQSLARGRPTLQRPQTPPPVTRTSLTSPASCRLMGSHLRLLPWASSGPMSPGFTPPT